MLAAIGAAPPGLLPYLALDRAPIRANWVAAGIVATDCWSEMGQGASKDT